MKEAWQIPNIWEGGEAWILGGGPSLLECFNIPTELSTAVRSHKESIEAYSPFLAKIHSKHVIGINVAYQFGSWVDVCFFGDKRFFLNHKNGLLSYKGLVVSSNTFVAKQNLSWIKYLPLEIKRDKPTNDRNLGISTHRKAVSWNYNSGSSAISLAAWMGVKRIILVGFDMTLGENNAQHFHNEYADKSAKPRVRRKKELPFNKHLAGFPFIKRDADNMGIEIINTSLNSVIKDFPKVHIKELL